MNSRATAVAGKQYVPWAPPKVAAHGLKLVAPLKRHRGKAPFVAVILAFIGVGLAGLILLSTAMQAQSFQIAELTRQSAGLEAERQALLSEVDRLSSPAAVAQRAVAEGMVPNNNPVFLRLVDGAVLGVPSAAKPDTNVKGVG